jgi:hypothetical protein
MVDMRLAGYFATEHGGKARRLTQDLRNRKLKPITAYQIMSREYMSLAEVGFVLAKKKGQKDIAWRGAFYLNDPSQRPS